MASDGREGGFIKLHRRLKSWPLWKAMTCAQRAVWLEILMSANWKSDNAWYGQRRYTVGRGQLSHSEATIAREAKVGRKVVRDAIARLVSEGAITRSRVVLDSPTTGNETGQCEGQAPWLITIVNYERFQGNDDNEGPVEGQARAKVGPSEGQGRALREEGEEVEERSAVRRPQVSPANPTYPLAEQFRRGITDRMARGELYPWQGGADVMRAVEEQIERVGDVEYAVEAMAEKAIDARERPRGMAWFAKVLTSLPAPEPASPAAPEPRAGVLFEN